MVQFFISLVVIVRQGNVYISIIASINIMCMESTVTRKSNKIICIMHLLDSRRNLDHWSKKHFDKMLKIDSSNGHELN